MDEMKTSTMTQAPPAAEQRTPPPHASGATPAPENKAPRSRVARIFLIAGVIVAALVIWKIFFATPSLPASIIALSGRIEGDDSAVAPKTSGKILEVTVREGDTVTAGQVIARLDDAQVRAREDSARAALAERAGKIAGRARSNRRPAGTVAAEPTADGPIGHGCARAACGRRKADLTAAEADLAQQQAALRLAEFNRDAYTRLAKTGAASEQQGLQAEVQADQQAAAVAAAQRRVESARGALTTAQANLENPKIRGSQVAGTEAANCRSSNRRSPQRKRRRQQAQAQLAQAEADRADLTVLAPFSGTVLTRAAEPGEVVQAGTAIVTLLDLSKVYLRGFIPEGEIGKVKVGQPAHIFLDSNSNQALDGYVLRIDPQATFTPENTYFRDDRVKQVVGVKVQLTQGIGFAKPGMPADGEILTSGTAWPPHKRAAQ